jgi:2-methylaconitate cis-trans-isomerase PrpF
VTIASAGLPNIFITAASLQIDPSLLQQSATELDSDLALHARLEKIRQAAAQHAGLKLSAASPKIVLVGPAADYTTSGGQRVSKKDFDVLVRAISSQNFHRTVPVSSSVSFTRSKRSIGNDPLGSQRRSRHSRHRSVKDSWHSSEATSRHSRRTSGRHRRVHSRDEGWPRHLSRNHQNGS